MVKKICFFILFCFASAFPQQISVKAYTDTTAYLIGDQIKFTIKVTTSKDVAVLGNNLLNLLQGRFDVPGISDPVKTEDGNKKITTFRYTLTRFDSIDVTVPPIPVYYRTGKDAENTKVPVFTPEQISSDPTIKTALSNPVTISVRTMKINSQEDIKDVKAPVTIPPDWKLIALIVLAALIIAGIILFIYLKYRKKHSGNISRPKIILPPHVAALNALRELDERKLWQEGKVKEYHTEITGIIRRYFEDKYHLPALELTTSEVMLHLRNIPDKSAGKIIDITYNFLSNADLVKFAKFTPIASVNEEMMRQAQIIINLTTEEPKPAVVPEANDVH